MAKTVSTNHINLGPLPAKPICKFRIMTGLLFQRLVPKARPRVMKTGTHMPASYAASRDLLTFSFKSMLRAEAARIFGMTGAPWVRDRSYGIDLFVGVHKSTEGDVDGLLGTVMDAGNGVLWDDDRQVVQSSVLKHLIPLSEPRFLDVTICVYETTGFEPKPKSKRGAGAKAAARSKLKGGGKVHMTAEEFRAMMKKSMPKIKRGRG